MISNDKFMDRLTADFGDQFSALGLSPKTLEIYDENPTITEDGFSFTVAPFITYPLSTLTVQVLNSKTYLVFKSTDSDFADVPGVKTAPKWFMIKNSVGQFVMGGRVGTYVHGMPLQVEKMVIEDQSSHKLHTFQFRFNMGEV